MRNDAVLCSDWSAQVKCLSVSFVISSGRRGWSFVPCLISIPDGPLPNLPAAVWLQNVWFTLWACVCMGGWLKWLPFSSSAEMRWKDSIFLWLKFFWKLQGQFFVLLREKSRHLQLKVKNSNSIGHGLHGREIKAFFLIKGIQSLHFGYSIFFKRLFILVDCQFE